MIVATKNVLTSFTLVSPKTLNGFQCKLARSLHFGFRRCQSRQEFLKFSQVRNPDLLNNTNGLQRTTGGSSRPKADPGEGVRSLAELRQGWHTMRAGVSL